MRVLYVSEYMMVKEFSGARKVSRIRYEIIRDIVGENNVDAVIFHHNGNSCIESKYYMFESYNSKLGAAKNVLSGNSVHISNKIIKDVLKIVIDNKYDAIFLDNRLVADILPAIKKNCPEIRIITNFHGISKYQFYENIIVKKRIGELFVRVGNVNSEKKAVQYSDICCLMNKRELQHFRTYYQDKPHIFLPCILDDIHNPDDVKCQMKYEDFNLLFVGTYFTPNNEGIAWFINHVVPLIKKEIQVYVVGNRIDKVKEEYNLADCRNIHFIGRVDSLNPWYQCANAVIAPIFSGDGMKTKTAEALMFGKLVVGTSEAFVGYEDILNYECNTAEEFADILNSLAIEGCPKFNWHNRERYLEEFSINAQKKALKKCLLEEIDKL